MQSHQMLAVFCLIFSTVFANMGHAQEIEEGGHQPTKFVFGLGLVVLATLSVYVVIKIRQSLRSDIDHR